MTRQIARQIALQLVFSMESNQISADEAIRMFFEEQHYKSLQEEDSLYQDLPGEAQLRYITELVNLVSDHLSEIDEIIERYSDSWKKNRLTKSTLAILRCAVCEICFMTDIPNSAAINEAVELGKKYDSPQAAAFINGILGSLMRSGEKESL